MMKKCERVSSELMVVERAAWWNPRVRRILKSAPMVVMFLLLSTRGVRAACSLNPSPDPTADGSSNSLRHAIQTANASGQDCVIQLQAGTYTLTIKNTNGQDNTAAQGDLDITDNSHTITIQGKGPGKSVINGNGIDRVFQVLNSANAVFSNLTIEGGIAQDNGTAGTQPGSTQSRGAGLLQNGGRVRISQVWIEGNKALGAAGRAGTAATGNGGPGQAAAGGGIFLSAGTLNLTGSKVSGNNVTGGNGGTGFVAQCSGFGGQTCNGQSGKGGIGGAATGGGLYVASGSVALSTSTVGGNVATAGTGGTGGGYFGPSTDGCCKAGGAGANAQGAGLFLRTGSLTLSQTTISGNSAKGGAGSFGGGGNTNGGPGAGGASQGGGLYVTSGNGSAKVNTLNSTFANNIALSGPGTSGRNVGFSNGGNANGGSMYLGAGNNISLKGVTVAYNQALAAQQSAGLAGTSSGGGIANSGAGLFINTAIVANNTQKSSNTGDGNDISGPVTASYSLIEQTAGANITDDGGNIFNQDPLLDGLRSNGGPTLTVALLEGSPADGTGDNPVCKQAPPTGLGGIDQRGVPRLRPGDEHCDMGAFQYVTMLVQPYHPPALFFGFQPVGHQSPPRTVTMTNNQTSSVAVRTTIGAPNAADFRILNSNCGTSLSANSTCTATIVFNPGAKGTRSAVLTVSDNPDSTSPYKVKLIGIAK